LAFCFQYAFIVNDLQRCRARACTDTIRERLYRHIEVIGILLHRVHVSIMILQCLAKTYEQAICSSLREFGIRKVLKKLVILLIICTFMGDNQRVINKYKAMITKDKVTEIFGVMDIW